MDHKKLLNKVQHHLENTSFYLNAQGVISSVLPGPTCESRLKSQSTLAYQPGLGQIWSTQKSWPLPHDYLHAIPSSQILVNELFPVQILDPSDDLNGHINKLLGVQSLKQTSILIYPYIQQFYSILKWSIWNCCCLESLKSI